MPINSVYPYEILNQLLFFLKNTSIAAAAAKTPPKSVISALSPVAGASPKGTSSSSISTTS